MYIYIEACMSTSCPVLVDVSVPLSSSDDDPAGITIPHQEDSLSASVEGPKCTIHHSMQHGSLVLPPNQLY